MENLDKVVLDFFVNNRTEWLNFLMLTITYAGGYMMTATVTALTSISFYIHNERRKIFGLLISVIGSSSTVLLLKNIFDKARPLAEAFYVESTASFPSGHSTIAVALYGFIFATILQHEKHPLKNKSLILLSLLILLIGTSRLYLGVHYLSDVLVGYLIGFVWLLIALEVSKSKT